jgi:hypothetical protein
MYVKVRLILQCSEEVFIYREFFCASVILKKNKD